MNEEVMRERLVDLTKYRSGDKDIDLAELVNLTVYNVSRELKLNQQNNYKIHFWVKESFNNEEENTHHYLYRRKECEAYEILSLLIRMENHYEYCKELLPE